MPTKELPKGQFSVAGLCKEIGLDPRMARAKLRKLNGKGVPPVAKNKEPHVFNEAWVFENKYRERVLKLIQASTPTKKQKVDAEDDEAAHDLASDVDTDEDDAEEA